MDRRTNRTDYTATERYFRVSDDTAQLLDTGHVMLSENMAFYADSQSISHQGRVTSASGEVVIFSNVLPKSENTERGSLQIVAPSFAARAIARIRRQNPRANAWLTTDIA